MELNKVTASIAAAATTLVATIGILIYRDFKNTRQINNLKKQQNILEANLDNLTKQQNILQTNLDNLTKQQNNLEVNLGNLTKQQNNLEANLNDRIIDIAEKTTSKLMEIKKIDENIKKANNNTSKLRKACKIGFDKIQNFFEHVGIDMTKNTSQEFYDANKEKLDTLRNLLENSHTAKPSEHKIKKSVSGSKEETSEISKPKENALGTNGTKDNETAPKLNKKTK